MQYICEYLYVDDVAIGWQLALTCIGLTIATQDLLIALDKLLPLLYH